MTHSLDYDTLPPHSRLRREFADGILKITAAPEEPGPLVRRAAIIGAAFPASLICALVLLLGFAVFGAMYESHRRYISTMQSYVLLGAFVIFCSAIFALIWRIQYTQRFEAAQNALNQTTILAGSKGRLIVETTGPLGTVSYDWSNVVSEIRVARGAQNMSFLEIELTDGNRFQILTGRDEVELQWVARAIQSAIF